MKTNIIFLTILVLFTFHSYSQVVKTEKVKSDDGTVNTISGVNSAMYDGTKSAKAQQYFSEASKQNAKDNLKGAEKLYLKAIKEDENYVEAYDNLGRIYRSMNKLDKALVYYKKSMALYPDGLMAHQNAAVVYTLLSEYENAAKEYKTIVSISPDNPEGYFGLANTYMVLKKSDKALASIDKAIILYKESNSHYLSEGYYLKCLIHYYNNSKDEARKYLIKAKELGFKANAQLEHELLNDENTTTTESKSKTNYADNEDQVIEYYDWLFNTPVGKNPKQRKEYSSYLIKWIEGAPNVSVEINDEVLTYLDCGDCLMIFLGSWTKYELETKDFDKLTANMTGTEDVIDFYKRNKSEIGKNKGIEKLIKLQEDGKLKSYIKSKI